MFQLSPIILRCVKVHSYCYCLAEHSRQGGPGDRYRPPTNRPHTEHSTQHPGGGGGHRQGMPPYREPNPPPYITNLARPDP